MPSKWSREAGLLSTTVQASSACTHGVSWFICAMVKTLVNLCKSPVLGHQSNVRIPIGFMTMLCHVYTMVYMNLLSTGHQYMRYPVIRYPPKMSGKINPLVVPKVCHFTRWIPIPQRVGFQHVTTILWVWYTWDMDMVYYPNAPCMEYLPRFTLKITQCCR
jgi:hypothetical protein